MPFHESIRKLFSEPLFVPQEPITRPDFTSFTRPAEPTGFRQAVEQGIPALTELGKTAFEFPGRPVREALERRGVSPGAALAAGFAADIATPLPGGEFKQTPRVFKGLKNLSTRLLEKFRGMPERIKPGRAEEIINLTKKQGLRPVEEQIFRESLVFEDVGKISPDLQPLVQEARKFKSAEEFVEAQPKFFHGTSKETADALLRGEKPKLSLPIGGEAFFGGKLRVFSLTPDPDEARGFAELVEGTGIRREGKVVELFLDPNANIRPLREAVGVDDIQKFIRENKIDAFREGTEISVVNPNVLKTKSQLTDFYNQAVRKGENLINLPKTAAKVEERLVPLTPTPVKSSRYSDKGQEFIGDGRYGEIVYQSPIKTSAGGVHFQFYPHDFPGDIPRGASQSFPNYFSHIRYEDMADGKTRKILENQSDLFQKGFLETKGAGAFDLPSISVSPERRAGGLAKLKKQAQEGSEAAKEFLERAKAGEQLQPYSSNDPLAHLRTFREEVKRAAKDGKDTLLIPSGETAMKIEGLGEQRRWFSTIQRGEGTTATNPARAVLQLNELKVGSVVKQEFNGSDWIITDVLGEGKFKAVPKRVVDNMFQSEKGYLPKDTATINKEDFVELNNAGAFQLNVETFDISGKVDTQHFVYKLNEQAIPREARKMGLEVTGKVNVDNGVWWQIKIPKERARLPVEAFGVAPFLFPKSQEQRERNNQPLFINR